MTENEAIERIIRSACSPGKCYDACLYGDGNCEYDAAIIALKEVQQYREIGTVEKCREAVEKQKAKKPDIYTDTRNMVDLHGNVYAEQANVYLCPTCESFIGYVGNDIFYYCPVCGQAIDENLEEMEDEL